MSSSLDHDRALLRTRKDASIIIYGYRPSHALAILALVLFALIFITHLYQVIRYRTKYFVPLVVGLFCEVIGYIARALSAFDDPYNVDCFIIQYIFIVVAPVFLSISIYTTLSMLIKRVGRESSPLPPKLILWLFITCDVIATVIQIAGAAMIGAAYTNLKDPSTANNILLAGLAFQVCTFFLFLTLLSVVIFRTRQSILGIGSSSSWFIAALVMASLLVYLRTCFRLAETAQGLLAPLSSNEAYFGALEFAPVVLAMVLFNIWHPGRYLVVGDQESTSDVEQLESPGESGKA